MNDEPNEVFFSRVTNEIPNPKEVMRGVCGNREGEEEFISCLNRKNAIGCRFPGNSVLLLIIDIIKSSSNLIFDIRGEMEGKV